MAAINSVVKDVWCHHGFQLVRLDKKPPSSHAPKASAANVDSKGTEWSTPFEVLASYGTKGIKMCWVLAIAGTGICLICLCAEKPWHVPANRPFLKELNLKLVNGPPSLAPSPALAQALTPAPLSTASAPSPGGRVALAGDQTVGESTGFILAPSGIMAAVEEDIDSNEDFHWAGDDNISICT
jgi:hypothetical protein